MSQHLIKEIQEIKRQLNEVASPTDYQQLEARVDMLQTSFSKMNDSITKLYDEVIILKRRSDPESQYPETQPIDPDETRWMEPDER